MEGRYKKLRKGEKQVLTTKNLQVIQILPTRGSASLSSPLRILALCKHFVWAFFFS